MGTFVHMTYAHSCITINMDHGLLIFDSGDNGYLNDIDSFSYNLGYILTQVSIAPQLSNHYLYAFPTSPTCPLNFLQIRILQF